MQMEDSQGPPIERINVTTFSMFRKNKRLVYSASTKSNCKFNQITYLHVMQAAQLMAAKILSCRFSMESPALPVCITTTLSRKYKVKRKKLDQPNE